MAQRHDAPPSYSSVSSTSPFMLPLLASRGTFTSCSRALSQHKVEERFSQTSALLSLCPLPLGWEPPVPLPAPAALPTGGRCRPQRPWGGSSLPPYHKVTA